MLGELVRANLQEKLSRVRSDAAWPFRSNSASLTTGCSAKTFAEELDEISLSSTGR